MANELHAHATSGKTLYAVLLSSTGQLWNGSAFETYNGANWTTYDIALTEAGAGIYLGSMPAAVAGAYSYAVYEQVGGSPTTTDTLRGTGWLEWGGSAVVAQTGDAYAVVNHADYGNAKLVRSTTPAYTLTVDASHQALALTNAVTNDAITAAAIANGAIDAATFAAGAIDAAAIADNAIDAGAIADGAITAAAIATNAIDADALAADGLAEIADAVWDEALAGHAGAGTAGAALSAATAPTAADVADAVWDEAIAGHADAGSTGAALSAAGAAGDLWTTALPGAYADGTAGDIIGNLVDDIGALTPAVAISATTAASVSTGALAVRTYHSLSQAISSTYAGNLNAATKLWLAVKAEKDDTDAQSVIFIEKTAGLTVLAGAAYTTVAHGSLTVGGLAGAWTVTVALDEVATGLLTAYADGMLWAECKALVAGSTVAMWDGVCDVARGIVNAVS